jgi:hypothetical protein
LQKGDVIKVEEIWRVEKDGCKVGGMYDLGRGLHQKGQGKMFNFPKDLYKDKLNKHEAIRAMNAFVEYYYRLLQWNEQRYIRKQRIKDSSIPGVSKKYEITVIQ